MINKQKFSLFCWNIGNPSFERAKKQAEWLKKRSENIFILTETKGSAGCNYIKNFFENNKYSVFYQEMNEKDYGVMIISRDTFKKDKFMDVIDYLPSRVASINLCLPNGSLEIIGLYIPSRNAQVDKIKRKRIFIEKITKAIRNNNIPNFKIICGDFNILEPNHYPHYSFFKDWEYQFYKNLIELNMIDAFRFLSPNSREYSWVGRTGNGYRYDHIFVSNNTSSFIKKCFYDHSSRKFHLSDHSGIVLELSLKHD